MVTGLEIPFVGREMVTPVDPGSPLDTALLTTTREPVSNQTAHTGTNASMMDVPRCIPSLNAPEIITDQAMPINLASHPTMPTPVNPKVLAQYLEGYPPVSRAYLLEGFSEGFRICNFISSPRDKDKNLNSANSHPEVVNDKLQKELQHGRLLGPLKSSPFPNAVISPLGLQPKKVPGEFRVIHDLSYPPLTSVNSGIPKSLATVHYSSVSDAVKSILKYGQKAFLAKTDIKSAFRIIPISPKDYHLLGFKWGGLYYFDKCLPMGASSSCAIFERFSSALHWIISQRVKGVSVIHVLDDFLFVGPSFESCQHALNLFLTIAGEIGVPIAGEKTMGPTTSLPFLGIQLDTEAMMASLPSDKIQKSITLIDQFLVAKSVTLRQMQSLCGIFNFACSVIIPGRAFSRRMYNLCVGVTQPFYKVKLTPQVKLDLLIWRQFLLNYNFKTFLLDFRWITSPQLHLFTDAASTLGFGGVFGSHWFHGLWPQACKNKNIALMELYPICLSFYLWGPCLANKCITLHCDNQAIVAIINSSTSKDSQIMVLVRKIVYICMSNNILIHAVYIPSKANLICDLLSRNQVQKAQQVGPHLDQHPTSIPNKWSLDMWLKESKFC